MITKKEIVQTRLFNQLLMDKQSKSPQEIAAHMGAIQAQDLNMAKWALGVRSNNLKETDIDTALANGSLIRKHLLRPTWHIVSGRDIYWILDLSRPQIKPILKSYDKSSGLNEQIHATFQGILQTILNGKVKMTRDEISIHMLENQVITDGNKLANLLSRAEIDGLVCSGGAKGGKQTYALLSEMCERTETIEREEALARLAERYFTSHGPASLLDFAWWSGLNGSDAKRALESVAGKLNSFLFEDTLFWMMGEIQTVDPKHPSVCVLPSFDEFLISYKDRTACIAKELQAKAFTNNGIFWPVVILNGQVKAIWKRTVKKDKLVLNLDFLEPLDKSIVSKIEESLFQFADFIDKKPILNK